jgi:asparagine synthase (glutamine-hydrolysing)
MCGIAGIALKAGAGLPDLRERLESMAQAMVHRGPDDQGVFVAPSGRAGLANRRLAIRDLSPAGHMPLGNDDSAVWISYNGEVYNADALRAELEALGWRFRSHSDTEVILRGYEAWGAQIVARLRGMFAFAILDQRPSAGASGRLLLARDPMGIKPLYYAQTEAGLVFASELKALLASGLASAEISPTSVAAYLLLGSVPNPLTIHRQISALEPATWLEIDLARPETPRRVTYWRLPDDVSPLGSHEETVTLVRERLLDAVRVRLVSDVPLGAFLSGGLDSSSVVMLMRAATDGPIRTCSMVFEEAEYSEASYARAVAVAAGAEHFERVITAQDVLSEFDAMLASLDQPSIDGVNTYFVSQTARQAGLTVALSGLGGDELFGGYPNTFVQAFQVQRALRLAQAVPGGRRAAQAAMGLLPNRQQWARVADALDRPASLPSAYLTRRGLFAPSEVQQLVTDEVWREAAQAFDAVGHVLAAAGAPPTNGASQARMAWISRAELRTYTHHQLLRDTDAMSMAHSLEVREPLLDVPLVEAVLRLPDDAKRNHTAGPKPLLAQAMGDRLPAVVRQRRDKQGFTFPFARWLRGPLQAQVEARLAALDSAGLLRPGAGQRVYDDYRQGRIHWSRPWALAVLAAATP